MCRPSQVYAWYFGPPEQDDMCAEEHTMIYGFSPAHSKPCPPGTK
jgi:hypothetical protein